TPTQFIEYSSAVASANVTIPNIDNITSISLAPTHQDKSSTIDNYDVLGFTIASNLTSKTLMAYITTNTNASDIAWRKAVKNGTSTYTNINGTETINNILIVNPNELRVQRNGSNLSLDFNPLSTINLTLPATDFPRGNFSATWTIPAFHVDWVGVRNLTLYNTTTTNPSGWIEYRAGAFYPANFTFNAPSWNNYTISGRTNFLSEFSVHRGYAPTGIVVPANVTKTADLWNGYGAFRVDIPRTGGITRMVIAVTHSEQATMGFPYEFLSVNLTATGFNGTAQASFVTNNNNDYVAWARRLRNGTAYYTQVGNNITINNQFQVNATELVVRRNGTRLTADFNPTTPRNVTLPVADFPRTNFSATFTMPAFHLDIDANGTGLAISASNSTLPSGWVQNTYALVYASSNGTIRIPSLNVTASSSTTFIPYLVVSTSGLLIPVIPEFPAQIEFFIAITSLTAFSGALLLRKRLKTMKLY
ncbi:MAG TPA: hypothetical protein VK209_10685, partial [Candidatus Sulfotelmatobacter sp.]|nr:hypothetical protein [Candidatus Sulfotelmatobacter sp.]